MTTRWDDYEYDELVEILSDYSKSVYGMRTRMNGEPRSVIIDALCRIDRDAPRVAREEREAEQRHIARFEARVAEIVESGHNRDEAVHILLEEEDYEGDYDYGCYLFNLPYGYFDKIRKDFV